ncbi:MAG: 30S ribosomal protein S6e [Candidatus Aenigmatarchaeota archaeon]
MTFKICINEPKARKSWQVEKEVPSLIGLKIGDKFDGSVLGLSGFTLQVTGGSDKEGFPMRYDLTGTARKKALMSSGPGFRPTTEGLRRRKYIRGNMISTDTMQVNCKIIEGEGDVMAILGIQPKEKKEEAKPEEEKK